MEASLKVVDLSAIDSLAAWARQREIRGRSLEDTLQKVMRYWVEAALVNIPVGNRDKINAYLRQRITSYSSLAAAARRGPTATTKAGQRAAARASDLRGTVAANIVAALNIYQARSMKAAQFYAAVNKWINRRIFSANLHRAGLIPARKLLRLSDRSGKMPRLSNLPGSIQSTATDDLASIVVENWASSHDGDGIVVLAGDAFSTGFIAAENRIAGWVHESLTNSARAAGLNVLAA